MKAILNGKAVVEMLKDFGLGEYEARIYFVLLPLGEAKVAALTRKAYVPQSKGYEVLDSLVQKGFAEETDTGKSKTYRAKPLRKVALKVIAREQRFIKRLNSNWESLQKVVEAIFEDCTHPKCCLSWASVRNAARKVALECLNRCGYILFFTPVLLAVSLSISLVAV
jgi:sugar-specific transcriptional regulator TrmB